MRLQPNIFRTYIQELQVKEQHVDDMRLQLSHISEYNTVLLTVKEQHVDDMRLQRRLALETGALRFHVKEQHVDDMRLQLNNSSLHIDESGLSKSNMSMI